MKIKNSLAMKWLRIFHISTSAVWFGGVVCILLLVCICFFCLNEADFLKAAPIVLFLYQKLILPVGLLTIFQGLIYGLFTNWGFKKHRWVVLKWLGTLMTGLCTGLGGIGRMSAAMEKAAEHNFVGGMAGGGAVLAFIIAQILLLLFMIVISVLKPFGKKKKAA